MEETSKLLTPINNTDEMLDLLSELSPVIVDIIEKTKDDQDIKKLIEEGKANIKEGKPEMTNREFGLKLFPILLKNKYRENIYRLIGAFNKKDPEQIACQPFKDTIADLRAILNEDFINFIKSII